MKKFRAFLISALVFVAIFWIFDKAPGAMGQSGTNAPAKRWECAELSTGKDEDSGCNLFLPPSGFEKSGLPLKDWYRKLGGHTTPNRPMADRIFPIDVLNLLGSQGWELVSVHPGSFGGTDYYFKRQTN